MKLPLDVRYVIHLLEDTISLADVGAKLGDEKVLWYSLLQLNKGLRIAHVVQQRHRHDAEVNDVIASYILYATIKKLIVKDALRKIKSAKEGEAVCKSAS